MANDGHAAASRATWPLRIYALGSEPGDDLSSTTTAEERLAMVATLSREAWALSGAPVPDYARRETPIVVRTLRPTR